MQKRIENTQDTKIQTNLSTLTVFKKIFYNDNLSLNPILSPTQSINSFTNNRNRRSYMVWRISNKKENSPSKEDIQSTAMIGLAVIIGLGIIAWGIQHLQYIG